MRILLKNGMLGSDKAPVDILIENEKIAEIGKEIELERVDRTIDCSGLLVMPGICDMHVHLRDPGQTHKEDILTGGEAAAAGGVTAVACMPNTTPAIDSAQTVEYILNKAKSAKTAVHPVGSITKGLLGEQLSDFAELKKAGCVAVSDDGRPVKNAQMMKEAIKLAAENDLIIISHTEDLDLISGGIINEGEISKKLDVKGMPRSSENYVTAREILLAQEQNLPVHIAHVSTKEVVEIIRCAKKNGARVTCETAPHYFTLTDEKLLSRDADYRMNPPLREKADVEAITEAVCDGTIDCIVTDHAPHAASEKADFLKSPNGVVGMETSLAVTLTQLVNTGKMTIERMIELMCVNPREILGIDGGKLEKGATADIAVVDMKKEWTVEPEKLHSKSKNTCFKGMKLCGKVKYTLLNGIVVYEE